MQESKKEGYSKRQCTVTKIRQPKSKHKHIYTNTQPICQKDGRKAPPHSNTGDAPIADLARTTQ